MWTTKLQCALVIKIFLDISLDDNIVIFIFIVNFLAPFFSFFSRLHLFNKKYSKNCNIMKYYKIPAFYLNIIFKCNLLTNFSVITPVSNIT